MRFAGCPQTIVARNAAGLVISANIPSIIVRDLNRRVDPLRVCHLVILRPPAIMERARQFGRPSGMGRGFWQDFRTVRQHGIFDKQSCEDDRRDDQLAPHPFAISAGSSQRLGAAIGRAELISSAIDRPAVAPLQELENAFGWQLA